MPELTRNQHQLATMVAFVGNEIRQDVPDVQRQVPPHVAPRWRYLAASSNPQPENGFNALATEAESGQKLSSSHAARVYQRRRRNPMLLPEGAGPSGAGVVKMRGNHANRA